MRISTTVMAHPGREKMVAGLLEHLDYDTAVTWDRHNDRHETGLRALSAYNPQAEYHLILQDDAVVRPDFCVQVERLANHLSDRYPLPPVCLYLSKGGERARLIRSTRMIALRKGCSFLQMHGPWWGVGLLIPTDHLPGLIAHYEASEVRQYDLRIADYYLRERIDWLYPLISLVSHRVDGDSLISGRTNSHNRVAWRFINEGEEVSYSGGAQKFIGHQGVLDRMVGSG